ADSMGEILVVRPVPCIYDHLASGGVHVLASNTWPGCLQRRPLSSLHNVEDLELLVGRFSKHSRASYIRRVVLNTAASVDQHDVAFAKPLRCDRPVMQCWIRCEQHER